MASDATRDGLGRAIVAAEERLAVLVERAAGDSDSGPLLAEALEELHTALAELFAASEEVEVEHQAAFAANLRYQQLFEMLPDGVLITDAAGVVIELNQAAATALGGRVGLAGMPLAVAIRPDDRPSFRQRLLALAAGESAADWEVDFAPTHGRRFSASVNVVPVALPGRDEPGLLWAVRGITALKNAEELEFTAPILALLNEQLDIRDTVRAVLTHVKTFMGVEAVAVRLRDGDDFPYYQADGFPPKFIGVENSLCGRDANGNVILGANDVPVMECMCGNVLEGRVDPLLPFFTEWGSFWTNNTTQLLAVTTEAERQAHTRNRCNAEGYESVALIPLRVGDRTLGLLQLNDKHKGCFTERRIAYLEQMGIAIAVALDRKQSEEALRASEARARFLAEVVERSAWPFAVGHADGSVGFVNEAFRELIGYTDEELRTLRWLDDLTPPEWRERGAQALAQLRRTGEPVRYEKEYVRKDGSRVPVELLVHLIRDEQGAPADYYAFVTDLTGRRRAEEAQRLATVGTLGAGEAHEFNNLLAAISGRAELAQDIASQDSYDKLIETALTLTQRGSELTGGLLSFARKREPQLMCVAIEEPIEAALAVVGRECHNRDVQVVWQPDPSGTLVQADPRQIQQVLVNLFVNACHAMPHGGTLRVATLRAPASGEVVVSVADTGAGIPPEDLPRVFEPFFTTKGVLGGGDTAGTGLGLSVSRGIIEAHGGSITLTSQVGSGTTFEIRLPAGIPQDASAEEAETQVTQATVAEPSGRRVLVADDETEVLDVVSRALGRAGYVVSSAPGTAEAIAILQQQPVDLVVSDLMMPGGGGEAILDFVRSLQVRPSVLLLTGRLEEDLEGKLLAAGASECLRKPVRLRELTEAARRHAGAREPGAA